MIPTRLLRKLRDAQRRQADSEEVKAVIHEIDQALGFDPTKRPTEPNVDGEWAPVQHS